MRNSILSLVICLLCWIPAWGQTTTGEITADETWSGTVNVTGDVVVSNGTLTISPGTVVKFAETNDNVAYGTATGISLVAIGQGAIQANGDASNRILFTTAAATRAKDKWRRIQFIDNGTRSKLSYCTIECGYNGLAVENTGDSVLVLSMEPSSPVVDNCLITMMSATGVYGSHGTNAQFTNVTIHDCNNGFFFNGAGSVSISYCYVYDVSSGFINAGNAPMGANIVTIEHVTMYNVDMMRTGDPKWWTGYGVYTCNDPGTATVTNSIFMMSTLANMRVGGWSVTHNYNCWYTGLFGLMNIEDAMPGANSVEADPLFTDPANGDFSLQGGSPAANSASDGKNMGAWQGTASVSDLLAERMNGNFITIPNPLTAGARVVMDFSQPAQVEIYTTGGQLVESLSGTNLKWDCQVAPGMYLYDIQLGETNYNGKFVVTK